MKRKILLVPLVLAGIGLVGCNSQSASSVLSSTQSSVVSSTVVSSAISNSQVSSQSSVSSLKPMNPKNIYASPTGNNETADGTKEKPYSIEKGISELTRGSTLYLLEGVYRTTSTLAINNITDTDPANSPEEGKTITPAVDNNGKDVKVTIDFTGMPFNSSNRGISINTNYWHIKGFEVKGAGDNGVYIGGNHNVIENLEVHDCMDSGIQLGRSSSDKNTLDSWPSYNTILNCTSYDNHDPSGEDSDGFACKLTTGVGNVFDGCIAYNNVDDGWDLYTKGESGPIGPVTLRNCIAFNNGITTQGVGTNNSDGNGFKLGGESIPVAHEVYNCLAFNNLATGFTDNSNPGMIRIENCTSFNNGSRDNDANNFDMCRNTATSSNYYKNLLSYCDGNKINPIDKTPGIYNSKDQFKGTAGYCLFYYGLSMLKIEGMQYCDYSKDGLNGVMFESDVAPFVDTNTPQIQSFRNEPVEVKKDIHKILRDENGYIKLGDLFRVNPESPFYTMGEGNTPLGCDLAHIVKEI
jgi:hypothetical protein